MQGHGTFVADGIKQPQDFTSAQKQILFLSLSTALSEETFRHDNTFGPIYAGMHQIFGPEGYNLLFTQIGLDWTPPPCLLDGSIQGVIYHGNMQQDFWQKHIRALPHVGLQYVNPALESDVVALDNYAFSYLCVSHLKKLGHTRIGFITDEIDNQLSHERFDGFLRAMNTLKLPVCGNYCLTWQRPYQNGIMPNSIEMPDYTERLAQAFAQDEKPTAFVCVDDFRAYCTERALEKLGLHVPQDISLTGSRNRGQHDQRQYTGVCAMLEEISQTAAEHLLAIIRTPHVKCQKNILVQPYFIAGDSTTNPR